MLRLVIVLGAIITGVILGGVVGAFLAFLLTGLIGAMIGPPEPRERRPRPAPTLSLDEGTEARKGKRVDPTAPSIQEEWSGALQNLKRRQ